MKKFFLSKRQNNRRIPIKISSRAPKTFTQDISRMYKFQKGMTLSNHSNSSSILSQNGPQKLTMKKLPKITSSLLPSSQLRTSTIKRNEIQPESSIKTTPNQIIKKEERKKGENALQLPKSVSKQKITSKVSFSTNTNVISSSQPTIKPLPVKNLPKASSVSSLIPIPKKISLPVISSNISKSQGSISDSSQECIVCNSCKNIIVPFNQCNGTKSCYWNNEALGGWLITFPSLTIPLLSINESKWIPENGVVFQPMACNCTPQNELALKIVATNKKNSFMEGSIIILNNYATKCFATPNLKRKFLENSFSRLSKKTKLENSSSQ